MRTEMIPLGLIDDSDRLRDVEPAWAEVFSLKYRDGEPVPMILVRPAAPPEVREGCLYELVYGGHRLAGARLAGLAEMEVGVRDLLKAEAKLLEIDENLDRNELSPFDRAYFLYARKQAYEALFPATSHGGDRRSKDRDGIKSQTLRLDAQRFTAEVAEKIGRSERTVQADIELISRLAPAAIPLLRRTSLVKNATELRRFAAHDAADQIGLAEDLVAGHSQTVAQARINRGLDHPIERNAQETLFNKLVELYGRANAQTKRRFEAHAGLAAAASRRGAL